MFVRKLACSLGISAALKSKFDKFWVTKKFLGVYGGDENKTTLILACLKLLLFPDGSRALQRFSPILSALLMG